MKTIDQLPLAELSRLHREALAAVRKQDTHEWTRKTRERVRQVLKTARIAA